MFCNLYQDTLLISFFYFFFILLFRAAPAAYGSSQARGQTGATAASYTTAIATQDPSHVCDQQHSSRQRQIPDPLSEARDRTCILMDTSQIRFSVP